MKFKAEKIVLNFFKFSETRKTRNRRNFKICTFAKTNKHRPFQTVFIFNFSNLQNKCFGNVG